MISVAQTVELTTPKS